MSSAPEIHAIGVCTFQRSALVDTLASLERQRAPDDHGRLVIFVSDNNPEPSAQGMVEAYASTSVHNIRYLHAPSANISLARNAILDAADANAIRYLAFIDDDERAETGWYGALFQTLTEQDASAVVGPVEAQLAPDAPRWMHRSRSHDTLPETSPDGRPIAGHSCNVLINLSSPAFRGRRFDLSRGRTGGEDTAYFAAAMKDGATLAFAPDAVVTETVAPERARLRWLLRRRYRMGQTHASLHTSPSIFGRARMAVLAGAKVFYCVGVALLSAPSDLKRNAALVRGALHIGIMSHALGLRDVQIYGQIGGPAQTTEKVDP